MGEPEMHRIGEWIARVLASPEDEMLLRRTRTEVEEMCRSFPLYEELATV